MINNNSESSSIIKNFIFGTALGIAAYAAKKGYHVLTPYIQTVFTANEAQRERLEEILREQNTDALPRAYPSPAAFLGTPERPINRLQESDEIDQEPLDPILHPVIDEDEEVDPDTELLEEPRLLDTEGVPMPMLPVEASSSLTHSSVPLDSATMAEFPQLALKEFRLSLVQWASKMVGYGVQLRLGRDRISAEEAKNLFISWMSWKIQSSEMTNTGLHLAANWLREINSLTGQELLERIESDLLSLPNGDDTYEQWKISGTMHGVHDFAVEHPEMCVAATSLINRILSPYNAKDGNDEISATRTAIVEEFKEAARENMSVVAPLVATGLLTHKLNPNVVRSLVEHTQGHESLPFTTLKCMTTFLNLINDDTEATEQVRKINQHIIGLATENPESFQAIVQIAQSAIEQHPELIAEAESGIQEAQRMMEKYPEALKTGLQVVPYALEHPKQIATAIRIAELLTTSLNTPRDADGMALDPEVWNLPESSKKAEQILTLLSASKEIMDILGEVKDKTSQTQDAPTEVAEASEVQAEASVVEPPKSVTQDQPVIPFYQQAAQEIGNACIKTVIEEGTKLPDRISHTIGLQGTNAVIDLSVRARKGEFDDLSAKEKTLGIIQGMTSLSVDAAVDATKSMAYKVIYAGLKTTIGTFYPSVKDSIPSYESASLAFQVANATFEELSKTEVDPTNKAWNTLMRIEQIALSIVASQVAAGIAQEAISTPLLSSFAAGVGESISVHGTLALQDSMIKDALEWSQYIQSLRAPINS